MSKVNSFTFIISTFLGKIPSILLEVLASYGVIMASQKNLKLVIGVLSLILFLLTLKKLKDKTKKMRNLSLKKKSSNFFCKKWVFIIDLI